MFDISETNIQDTGRQTVTESARTEAESTNDSSRLSVRESIKIEECSPRDNNETTKDAEEEEEKPLVNVCLRSHEGFRSDRPYSMNPSQMVS